jgi:hypothetical protein
MTQSGYDYTRVDAASMPVEPVASADFDYARYAAFAQEADQRYDRFMAQDEGIMVWQRIRAADVFRGGCADMDLSLRLQLGCLTRAMDYLTDAPGYLEPWYGIGTIGSAFGAEYFWSDDQAPAVLQVYDSLDAVPDPLEPRSFEDVPILRHTLEMIAYFLEETGGRLPMSWCDIQNPLNTCTEIIDTTTFMAGLITDPDTIRRVLPVLADALIRFTRQQTDLIGDCLARPGHGFASSRLGTGIGMSTDNVIMIAPDMFSAFFAGEIGRVGKAFGGTVIHSCGNWARWIDAVRRIPHVTMMDAAFSAQIDPAPNACEPWRDALAGSGIVLQARPGREPEEVLQQARRLWQPGMKLIVVTLVEDPAAQHRLYHDLHHLCQ